MAWDVALVDEVAQWFELLVRSDPESATRVAAAFDLLEEHGPHLGRPLVDTLKGSALPNRKELRPGSRGRSEIRILFAFDPHRQAIHLVAGDKAGTWARRYRESIPLAESRFQQWLDRTYE